MKADNSTVSTVNNVASPLSNGAVPSNPSQLADLLARLSPVQRRAVEAGLAIEREGGKVTSRAIAERVGRSPNAIRISAMHVRAVDPSLWPWGTGPRSNMPAPSSSPEDRLSPAQKRTLSAARSIAARGKRATRRAIADHLGIGLDAVAHHIKRIKIKDPALWPWRPGRGPSRRDTDIASAPPGTLARLQVAPQQLTPTPAWVAELVAQRAVMEAVAGLTGEVAERVLRWAGERVAEEREGNRS